MSWENFLDVLKGYKPLVYKKICEYLPDPKDTWMEEHWKAVRDYPDRQGKYLRPALVLLMCEMLGGKKEKAVLTAAGMQTSEDWILNHDDIEDKSEERRGKPAIQHVYGLNVALNAGDALHMIMWKMFKDNFDVLDHKTASRVFDKIYEILIKTAEGQYYEESWIKYNKIDMTEEDYYKLVDTKAGWYTIIGPMMLGAIVAGAEEKTLSKIEDFGIPFGRAFQIRDDTLNITASFADYGKETAGDIMEGKRTLILVHLLKHCKPDEKKRIMAIYSKPREEKTEAEKKYVLELMKKYKSVEYADSQAEKYGQQAIDLLKIHFADVPRKEFRDKLIDGIQFVYKRPK